MMMITIQEHLKAQCDIEPGNGGRVDRTSFYCSTQECGSKLVWILIVMMVSWYRCGPGKP